MDYFLIKFSDRIEYFRKQSHCPWSMCNSLFDCWNSKNLIIWYITLAFLIIQISILSTKIVEASEKPPGDTICRI